MKKTHKSATTTALSKETILAHLATHPGDTKRDLARVLGVRGSERQLLKRILKEMTEEGLLQRGKKKSFAPPGALPDVTVIEITGEDADGEPLGRPATWTRNGEAPIVLVLPGRDDAGPALGRGDKVLAKITRTKEGYEAPCHQTSRRQRTPRAGRAQTPGRRDAG